MEDASRDPGSSDGRPLSSQYYDPRNPMPGYDVSQLLQDGGLAGPQLSEALQSVEHNDPDAGMPHDWFGRGDAFPLSTTADPVLMFTGQYSLVVTDVWLSSVPFPLHLTRTYTSGEVSFGPFGYNWDHNYNCYVRPLSSGSAAVWTGARHEDVYAPRPDGEFEPPTGVFRLLTHDPGGIATPEQYVVSDREGLSQVFERPDGWPLGDRLPLVRLEDKHGRHHDLEYDADGRVSFVRDEANRFLRFGYGDCGLLEFVEDQEGRRWTYQHADEVEHLVAVTTPSTPDRPTGLTTRYGYDDWQEHPALVHNLVHVIDADGRLVVDNTYGTDPMTWDFGRIVRQDYGPWAATFAAAQLQYVPRTPDAVDVPAWQISVVDPGILRVYTFNYRGDLLDERFRLVYDGSYRLVARAYRYDEQGNMVERREPNGLGMAFVHDTTNTDPRARGNLLRAELLAPPTRPAPSRIVQRLTYEPQFHRLKTLRDELGRTTTWEYDYETAPGGVGDVVAIAYPDATLPDGTMRPGAKRSSMTALVGSPRTPLVRVTGTSSRIPHPGQTSASSRRSRGTQPAPTSTSPSSTTRLADALPSSTGWGTGPRPTSTRSAGWSRSGDRVRQTRSGSATPSTATLTCTSDRRAHSMTAAPTTPSCSTRASTTPGATLSRRRTAPILRCRCATTTGMTARVGSI